MQKLNIQTERLDNHTARFTVEVEPKQWEDAKKESARELSKRYRIPGFRKGKAPYKVMVRYIGEAPIVEDAMEKLGNNVYREVLDQTELEPYAAGNLENFELEPNPTYTFTVPLQPEIDLGDYRAIRVDFEKPEVTDEDVDTMMRQYQQQHAVVEESSNAIQSGDRVTVDIYSEFVDGAERSEESDEDDKALYKGDTFIQQQNATFNLDTENEPLLPGFIDAMVGANVEETVEFELTVPDDDEGYIEDVRGRKVSFQVTVKKVENVTLPELNDDLAARISENEDEPLTLLELRVRTREDLQEQAENRANSEYSDKVLEKIVEGATFSYPEVMVVEHIHNKINEFDASLREQGMDIETYQKVMGVTHDDLHEQYHDEAVETLERTLALGEVLVKEGVQVTADDVNAEVEKTLSQFGEQADIFRQYFDNEQQRSMIANNILFQRLMERLAKIGKGEPLDEPEVEEDEAGAEETDQPEASIADTEAEIETSDVEVEESPDETEAEDDAVSDEVNE